MGEGLVKTFFLTRSIRAESVRSGIAFSVSKFTPSFLFFFIQMRRVRVQSSSPGESRGNIRIDDRRVVSQRKRCERRLVLKQKPNSIVRKHALVLRRVSRRMVFFRIQWL